MVNGANVTGLNFTATVQRAHSVALAWNKSISTVSGYNVYRSTVSGTGYTKLNSSLVSGLAYTDTDSSLQNGTTYFYVTTTVDAIGIESDHSNEVSAAIP
jgi:fibronectin type 3 domain-containing protein